MPRPNIYQNKKELISSLVQPTDVVLDLGFWGQGVMMHHDNWVHRLLLNQAKEVYGLDVEFDPVQVAKLPHPDRYKIGTAEDFDFDVKFEIIGVLSAVLEPGQSFGSMAGYISGKFALRGLLRDLASELASSGIRVNAVSPGFMDTNLSSDLPRPVIDFLKDKKRVVEPSDVAKAVRILCSTETTGVNVPVLANSNISSHNAL